MVSKENVKRVDILLPEYRFCHEWSIDVRGKVKWRLPTGYPTFITTVRRSSPIPSFFDRIEVCIEKRVLFRPSVYTFRRIDFYYLPGFSTLWRTFSRHVHTSGCNLKFSLTLFEDQTPMYNGVVRNRIGLIISELRLKWLNTLTLLSHLHFVVFTQTFSVKWVICKKREELKLFDVKRGFLISNGFLM